MKPGSLASEPRALPHRFHPLRCTEMLARPQQILGLDIHARKEEAPVSGKLDHPFGFGSGQEGFLSGSISLCCLSACSQRAQCFLVDGTGLTDSKGNIHARAERRGDGAAEMRCVKG